VTFRQVEVLLNAYLLNFSFKTSLRLTALWGLVLYLNTLVQPTMDGGFFGVAIFGGAGDLVIVSANESVQ
jgi:hypothetical protein